MNERSVAAIELTKLSAPVTDIAAQLDRSVNYVYQLRTARRQPADDLKRRIAELWPHIRVELWDVPAAKPPVHTGVLDAEALLAQIPKADSADSPRELAARLMSYARREEQTYLTLAGQADPNATKILVQLSDLAVRLGKLTGYVLTEREVLSSTVWRQVEDRLFAALDPYPDAARAVVEALGGSEDK